MTRITKVISKLLISISVIVFILCIVLFCFLEFTNFGIENEVYKKLESSKYDIYLYNRDAGATTGFSNHVFVTKKNKKLPNKAGNTFSATDVNASISLLDDETLLIEYDNTIGTVFKKEQQIYDLKIVYKIK